MNIIKLCQTEEIQLLLIAGDLFDNVHVQENTLEDIKNGFASLKILLWQLHLEIMIHLLKTQHT